MKRILDWIWMARHDREARKDGYCCYLMSIHSRKCPEHDGTAYWCPDQVIQRWECGMVALPVHPDGGGGGVIVRFCPWCAERIG